MPDRSKMSKRKEGSSVRTYRDQGILPEALINYLALLGWNPGTEQELFSIDELIEHFDIGNVNKSGAIFDAEKLRWFNHEYTKKLSVEKYAQMLSDFTDADISTLPIALIKERARTFGEAAELIQNGEYSFAGDTITYDAALLLKGAKTNAETAKIHLTEVLRLLGELSEESFTTEGVKEVIFPYATQEGRGAVLWPLRTALSGREKSPDPFTICSLIGKDMTLRRIADAIEML